ncbi:MAG: hypothetical protein OEV79_12190, partial [candidate division WOR-3 bacterium]|nr:hypothetical protein [candidate division WOR-3 bacterium]
EGTPEDIAAIEAIFTDDYPELLIVDEIFNDSLNSVNLADVEILWSEMVFSVDSPLIKQHADSCGLRLNNTPLERVWDDMWFTKDTACTVYYIDTFDFSSLAHADLQIVGHYDSVVISGADTIWMIGTVDTIDIHYYAEPQPAIGDGRRLIFFDVIREWIEDPQNPGDSVYAVVDPRQWFLSKLSYGSYYFPIRGADAPYIDRVILARQNGLADTILASNTDTTYTGHVMNRFRSIDSLLEYTSGDSIAVTVILGGQWVVDECSFFVTTGDGPRVNILSSGSTVELIGGGITNIYFEVVKNDVYYCVNPLVDYKATLWLIPVVIN